MSPARARELLAQRIASADVQLDGPRPWDIRVHDQRMPQRVLMDGSLGVGESYMDRWWDCEALDDMLTRVLRARIDETLSGPARVLRAIGYWIRNPQSTRRAFIVGRHHYDIGDDLYRRMLDRRMIYSCGYWPRATDLDTAQEHKLDLVCRKLGLEPGMRVLDIGCGWGGAARFAAERYGVQVTGITVSRNQAQRARETCAGLPIDIRLEDYRMFARSLEARFDRIYSLGMFEHVGTPHYREFFEKFHALLRDDGVALLHTIAHRHPPSSTNHWIRKYIFPGG
ncbi:MAG: methyltransferase domain-containing protein, partial [Gammaproteobacteria bacterium]|nr:methyltransferase domain-containing protein [Gammaproteobacteria bacterium]